MSTRSRIFEFWLGRAGSGKTYACLDSIARELRERKRGYPLLFLVPEQASAQVETALAMWPGVLGFTRARVLTFERILREVFSRVEGRPRQLLDPEGRVLVLRRILRRRKSDLRIFDRTVDAPKLAESLSASLLEFQRYGWTLADLESRCAELESEAGDQKILRDKLRDLALIWSDYEGELERRGLFDSAMLTQRATELIGEWNDIEGAHLWIDGFASFTTAEFQLLEGMLGRVERAALTLCLDPAQLDASSAAQRRFPKNGFERVGHQKVFDNVERTYSQIRERMSATGWHIRDIEFPRRDQPTRFSNQAALEQLESRVLTSLHVPEGLGIERFDAASSLSEWPALPIELLQANSVRTEVEGVARRIATLCMGSKRVPGFETPSGEKGSDDEGPRYRWSEVAVIVRDLQPYESLVREIFGKYSIPYFIDRRRHITGHPLSRLLLGAVRLAQRHGTGEAVLNFLKTGLTPVDDADEIAALEALAIEKRFDRKDWDRPDRWTVKRRAKAEGHPESRAESQEKKREPGRGEELFEVWTRARQPLDELRRSFADKAGVSPAVALGNFLETTKAHERVEAWAQEAEDGGDHEAASIHREAWVNVSRLIARLGQVFGNLDGDNANQKNPGGDNARKENGDGDIADGSGEVDLNELYLALETGLATTEARLIPPSLEQVLVGSVERSRTPQTIKAAFVLGMNDGVFPRIGEEDPILGDEERARLIGATRSLGPDSKARYNHERYLTYIALTRASEFLCVSRPAQDEKRRPVGPSSFFRAIARAFPEAGPIELTEGDPAGVPGLPLLREAWAAGLARSYHGARDREDAGALGRYLRGSAPIAFLTPGAGPPSAPFNATLAAAKAESETAELDAARAHTHWEDHPKISVGALEEYVLCPFKFYASRMLGLKRKAEPRPGPLELGELRHYILERLFHGLKENGKLRWGGIELDRADRIIDESAEHARSGGLQAEFGPDALTREVIALVAGEMKLFARALKTMGARYEFVQTDAERNLSLKISVSPLEGRVGDSASRFSFEIRGKIDRLDRFDDESGSPSLVLYDFKSSETKLSAKSLYHGALLQLPLYSVALERERNADRGSAAARVAGFFYWPLRIGLDGDTKDEKPADDKWMLKGRPNGVFDESIAGHLDNAVAVSTTSPFFGFSRKKDGELVARKFGHLPSGAFEGFLGHVGGMVQDACDAIASGKIQVYPMFLSDTSGPCEYCDFRSVCRIDLMDERPRHSPDPIANRDFVAAFAPEEAADE